MNIAFVYPECENIGVEYLSACLKKAGHNINLIFDPMLFGSYYLSCNILKNFLSYRKKIVNNIIKAKYDLICFSVFSDYYSWACDIARELKSLNNNIRIIFGGIHASSVPECIIQESFIDYVCIGEGEEAIVELAGCLELKGDTTRIKNIWAKKDGIIIQNQVRPLITSLDDLPFPDKEMFAREYKSFVKSVYSIITSRGCPNACTYCYNSYYKSLYKDKGEYLRRRSVNNVIEELLYAKKRYNFKRVAFFDDLFIFDLPWLGKFAEAYTREVNLPYFCHVHPSYINKKSINLLKSSGCATVTMGIQTTNANIRKKILGRNEDNNQIESAIKLIKEANIFLYTNIIFGLPLQDESIMIEDVEFSNKFRVDIPASNWLRYYPKTKILQIAKERGLLNDDDIKNIEKSDKYLPYSIKGNTYNKIGAKLRNILLLSHLLPKLLVSEILKRKLYRLFPAINLRFYMEVLIMGQKTIFSKKKITFAYLSLMDVIKYYFYYFIKIIKYS